MVENKIPIVIDGWDIYPVHLPYMRPVRWAGHEETGADFLLLVLHTIDGISGIGEASVRIQWNGLNIAILAKILQEILLPQLKGFDISEEQITERVLSRYPQHSLANSMIDAACWDIRAQAKGMPLWKLLGGQRRVPVSWTLTRQAPGSMAEEAAQIFEQYGFQTIKVKTGQGLNKDREVLKHIRSALGDAVQLYADANSDYEEDDVPAYTSLLAEFGCVVAEDPCYLMPDEHGKRILAASAIPVLVDKYCSNLFQSRVFLNWGAEAISVKYPKSGISESIRILALADELGARAHIGIGANSSLGGMAALSLAATRLKKTGNLPSEESFFLQFAEEYVFEPLEISEGTVKLPGESGFVRLVDWNQVKKLAI
ncbi:mandelate racemase/muconate lactonizing enzyme family protein [Thermodesulfobacteriota bacterium]